MYKEILSNDGKALYFSDVFTKRESKYYFQILKETITWQRDTILIFGKEITTQREVAWYGENEISYTYSKSKKTALTWTKELIEIRRKIEIISKERFNSCLLNFYHDGTESMGWHADDEKELKPFGKIASVSFGAERPFFFKHKQTSEKIELLLENGSLLLMQNEIQEYWKHSLPKRKRITEGRINLTFRNIIQ